MIRVLACGVGVQTVAEVIRNHQSYDAIIFSDTGSEKEETYYYVNTYLLPFVKENKINFVVVSNGKYESLYDYCIKHREIPKRNFRWCTDKFKRQPINQYIRKTFKAHHKTNVVEKAIGISLDESERLNTFTNEPKYIKTVYPLIDDKITRLDCKRIIEDAGLPLPIKSGCWFCPFAKKEEFRRLKIEKPELWKQLIIMEKNHPKYPNVTLKFTKPFEKLDFNFSLTDFEDFESLEENDTFESCDSGHCFV